MDRAESDTATSVPEGLLCVNAVAAPAPESQSSTERPRGLSVLLEGSARSERSCETASTMPAAIMLSKGANASASVYTQWESSRAWSPDKAQDHGYCRALSSMSSTSSRSETSPCLKQMSYPITAHPRLTQRRHSLDTHVMLYNPPPTPEGSVCDENLDLYVTTERVYRHSLGGRSYSMDAGVMRRYAQEASPADSAISSCRSSSETLSSSLKCLHHIFEQQEDTYDDVDEEASTSSSKGFVSMEMIDLSPPASPATLLTSLPEVDGASGLWSSLSGASLLERPSDPDCSSSLPLAPPPSPPTLEVAERLKERHLEAPEQPRRVSTDTHCQTLSRPNDELIVAASTTKSALSAASSASSASAQGAKRPSPPKRRDSKVRGDDCAGDLVPAKAFACRVCSGTFFRNYDLKRHQRIHDRQRPFVCPSCDKTFTRQDALHRHMKIVNGKRPTDGYCRSKKSRLASIGDKRSSTASEQT